MHVVLRILRTAPLPLIMLLTVGTVGANATTTGPEATNSAQAALTLVAAGQHFSARYAAATPNAHSTHSRGGAILLPGQAGGPDETGEVMGSLGRALAQDGWTTLSVALPAPTPPGDDPTGYVAAVDARLDAAIAYLHRRGLSNLVMIGEGLGANAGAQYLSRHPDRPIEAFVDIGTGGTQLGPIPAPIPTVTVGTPPPDIKIPVLDIRADGSLPTGDKPARGNTGAAAEAEHAPSPDKPLRGNLLVKRVRSWLRGHAAGAQAQRPLRTAKQ